MKQGKTVLVALASGWLVAAGGMPPDPSHRVAPATGPVAQITLKPLPPAPPRGLKGLFAPVEMGCSQASSRRIALLGTYFGNVQSKAKGDLDSLQKSLTQNGFRVIRFDNLDPKRITANVERDRSQHPCDYSTRAPLIVLDGAADTKPSGDGKSRHFMKSEQLTAEFPSTLSQDDEVTPKQPTAGSAYRLVRRTSSSSLVTALVQGVGLGNKANLVLACDQAGRARDELDPQVRAALGSVTVSGPTNSGLLGRLKEGAANPSEFDRNGDGTVSNQELFPKVVVDKTARGASDPFRRPQPKPVANVETEGNGYLVGFSPAPRPTDFR